MNTSQAVWCPSDSLINLKFYVCRARRTRETQEGSPGELAELILFAESLFPLSKVTKNFDCQKALPISLCLTCVLLFDFLLIARLQPHNALSVSFTVFQSVAPFRSSISQL